MLVDAVGEQSALIETNVRRLEMRASAVGRPPILGEGY
jgi:hypothetical protein